MSNLQTKPEMTLVDAIGRIDEGKRRGLAVVDTAIEIATNFNVPRPRGGYFFAGSLTQAYYDRKYRAANPKAASVKAQARRDATPVKAATKQTTKTAVAVERADAATFTKAILALDVKDSMKVSLLNTYFQGA